MLEALGSSPLVRFLPRGWRSEGSGVCVAILPESSSSVTLVMKDFSYGGGELIAPDIGDAAMAVGKRVGELVRVETDRSC